MNLAQTLSEPNPAAHAIWFVGILTGLVLGVIALLEAIDWFRSRLTRGQEPELPRPDPQRPGFKLERPRSELRRRFFHRVVANPKKWTEGLIETDSDRPSD